MFIIGKENNKEEFDSNIMPCGICLQFMAEFVNDNFPIYIFTNSDIKIYTLKELLPYRFKKEL